MSASRTNRIVSIILALTLPLWVIPWIFIDAFWNVSKEIYDEL